MVSTVNKEALIILAESTLKALDIVTEVIEAVDVADQLEYGKDNNNQSSQSQIKVIKKILTAKVKKANNARKKASSNKVKQLRDLTSIKFKTAIPNVKTISFHVLFLKPI